jgi:hypothetical protein
MNIERGTNLIILCISLILIIGCLIAPATGMILLWLGLILGLMGLGGLISLKYMKAKIRKNYSIAVSSLCASIATFFATGGAFPPISLIFALLFLLQVLVFLDFKKKRLA